MTRPSRLASPRPEAPSDDAEPQEATAFTRSYAALVSSCLHGEPDEALLRDAYEFGRSLFDRGAGPLDLVALHHRVLPEVLAQAAPTRAAAVGAAAGRILIESLAPFEMTRRGFQEAQAALARSQERYRDLVENASDMIFTTDLEGRVLSLNRAGERLTEYRRDQADGLVVALPATKRPVGEPVPDDRPMTRTRFEVELTARDGRRIPVEVNLRRVFENGHPVGYQGIARDITDRRSADSAMRYLNRHLEEKAKRIAHALHDEAGQLLATVYLRVAEISTALDEAGRDHMAALRTLLDQVDDQIRRLAHELRPTVLDDLGLIPACRFLAEGVAKRAGVHVSVVGSTGGRLPADVETALYRVTQEALANASRHARAASVVISFSRDGNRLSGFIRDDGVGFDLTEAVPPAGPRGLGLVGMRERLVAVGGRLAVRSAPGAGTAVEFEMELES